MLEQLLNQIDSLLGSAFYFPFLLVGTGVFFTIYLGFPQIRFFVHGWKVLFGRYADTDDPGDTSHFQALSTALSGTVGTGNIGGVALALYLGGPAALFWMWITALVGMTTKFVEVTLSHKYRKEDANGQMAGGPMYFMEYGLNMKWLAVFFAVATVISSFGSGNMPQSNNMAEGLQSSFGIEPWITGLVLSVAMFAVIVGGIKRIAAVAGSIVPIMALLYAVGALAVIVSNFDQVIPSFLAVFKGAFSGTAATGGFLGASFAYAFNRGVNRGLYSNEAGQGSAPIAHAAARTKEPVAEGMVAILEPFIDTLIICTMTGLVILSSGVWQEKFETDFQSFDMEIVAGNFTEQDPAAVKALYSYMNDLLPDSASGVNKVEDFDGTLPVVDGRIGSANAPAFTIIHNRSIAEDVRVDRDGKPFTGTLTIDDGTPTDSDLEFSGKSSAALGTPYSGGIQAQLSRRLWSVCGFDRTGDVRVQHGCGLVLLWGSRDHLPVWRSLGIALQSALRLRIFQRDHRRYVANLAAVLCDRCAHDDTQSNWLVLAAQRNEKQRSRLLGSL